MHLDGSSDTTAGEAQGEVKTSLKGGGSHLSLQLQAFMFPDQRSYRGNEVAHTHRHPSWQQGYKQFSFLSAQKLGFCNWEHPLHTIRSAFFFLLVTKLGKASVANRTL